MSVVEKVRTKIQEIRARRPKLLAQRQTRGQVIGGGALIERARQRVETLTARIKERKPQLIPKVKEWKPGERIREVLAPQTSAPAPSYYGGVMDRPGLSVETEREQKLYDHRNISVEW